MEIRDNYRYSGTHQWVKDTNGVYAVGITDYAQAELGGLVFVNLPEVGEEVTAGQALGDVESTKVVADVTSPLSGVVCEVNEAVLDMPEQINESPYEAWLIKVQEVSASVELFSAEEYQKLVDDLTE